MPHYVGLDASKSTTSICILDEKGDVVRQGVVETDPVAIVRFLRGDRRRYRRIGIEAMGFTPWIYEGLAKAGLPIICIENRHAHAILKAKRINKTDRNDARGIAELMREGLYKKVHIKTPESQETKVLLAVRKALGAKRHDIENLIRSLLLQIGRKLPTGGEATFERRARALIRGDSVVEQVVQGLLRARQALTAEIEPIETRIEAFAEADPVCQRLMAIPGVAHLTAATYKAAIDIPERFVRSRDVGVHLGLTPPSRQSGAVDRRGRISCFGDREARRMLFIAARAMMWRRTRNSPLKAWGVRVIAARGFVKGIVAVARKLAVIMHRMWLTGEDFRLEDPGAA